MKNKSLFIFILGIIFLSNACTDAATHKPPTAESDSISVDKKDVINEGFLNKDAQSKTNGGHGSAYFKGRKPGLYK